MALTVAQVRAVVSTGLSDEVVQRWLTVASALVSKHAPGAPDTIKDEAALRTIGYLCQHPTDARRTETDDTYSVGNMPTAVDALHFSSAKALLAPWRVHRAGGVGAPAATEPATPPGTWVLTGQATIDIAVANSFTGTGLALPDIQTIALVGLLPTPPAGHPAISRVEVAVSQLGDGNAPGTAPSRQLQGNEWAAGWDLASNQITLAAGPGILGTWELAVYVTRTS